MTASTSQNVFWFAAGLLSALAVAFAISPWLAGRSAPLRAGWRRLRWPLLGGAALVSLAGVGLYERLGASGPMSLQSVPASAPSLALSRAPSQGPAIPGTQAAGSMGEMRARLEQRLARQGGTPEDWELLAKTYEFLNLPADAARARTLHQVAGASAAAATPAAAAVAAGPAVPAGPASAAAPAWSARAQRLLTAADAARRAGRYRQAAPIYRQLADLDALDAQGWADYADVTASLQNGHLAGEPQRLIETALSRDPDNQKALWLEASAQHETRRYAAAIATWHTLIQLVPAASSDAQIFTANLAEDEALAAGHPASSPPAAPGPDDSAAVVSGEVQLTDAVRGSVPAGSTLFVVARSLASPGPPVAVLRIPTDRWPRTFRLDDTLAMLPGRALSTAGEVAVQARVSLTGQALPQAGDLQSEVLRVDPHAAPTVRLIIDQVVR